MITMNQKVLCLYAFASNALRRKWLTPALVPSFINECEIFGTHLGLWTREEFHSEAKAIDDSVVDNTIPGLDLHKMTPVILEKINHASFGAVVRGTAFNDARAHYNAVIPEGYAASKKENLRSNVFAQVIIACAVPSGMFSDMTRIITAIKALEHSVSGGARRFTEVTNGFALAAILDGKIISAPLAEAVAVVAGVCGEAKMDELLAHYAKGTQHAPGTTIN